MENIIALFLHLLRINDNTALADGGIRIYSGGSTFNFVSRSLGNGDDADDECVVSISNDLEYGTYMMLIRSYKPGDTISRAMFSFPCLPEGHAQVAVQADAVAKLRYDDGDYALAYFYKVGSLVSIPDVLARLERRSPYLEL